MSKGADLELKLTAYNAKILFWNRIYINLSKFKLGHLLHGKIKRIKRCSNEEKT